GANAVVTNSGGSASTLTISPTSGSTTFFGNLGGNLNLVFSGAGGTSQALNGNNSYTGATTVSGGLLIIGSSSTLASTNVSVASGAALNVLNTTANSLATGTNLTDDGTVSLAGNQTLTSLAGA